MSELSEFLDSEEGSKITMTAKYMGLVEQTSERDGMKTKYFQDEYRISFSFNGKTVDMPVSYKQGIGHRKLDRTITKESHNRYYSKSLQRLLSEEEAVKGNHLKRVDPSIADVLYCCLRDGSDVAGSSFENWCSDFGYDTDSRKALATYLACQEEHTTLVKLFGSELFNKLAQLEH